MRKLNHTEVFNLRQAGVRAADLAIRYGVSRMAIYKAVYKEGTRRAATQPKERPRIRYITTDTTPVFAELADGWYGYFLSICVGPFPGGEGYGQAVAALSQAITRRLMPTEAQP